MLQLPKQQWAIESHDIRPVGGEALRAYGPNINCWRGITACMNGNHKPCPAFYTSTVTENGFSDWVNFGTAQGRWSDTRRWMHNEIFVFDILVNPADILVVEEYSDYEDFCRYYRTIKPSQREIDFCNKIGRNPDNLVTIDWVQAALDGCDAVWIKDPYCHPLLHAMDVEQTIWLHMPTTSVVRKQVIPRG